MYESLYRFLVKHKKIYLPGIGTIGLRIQPAESDFVNRSFSPPAYFFALEKARLSVGTEINDQQGREAPQRTLFSWLAANFNITEREAVIRFTDFVFDLKKQLDTGEEITWNGVGTFQKEFGEEIRFKGAKKELPFLEEIIAEKVIRENAEHTMLVGEVEKTSTQMTEMLLNPVVADEKRNYWWVWPLAVILMILIFLGWYFSEHGISGASTGNNRKISPAEAPFGYKLSP
jgi:nucleoid DNA-binding protein